MTQNNNNNKNTIVYLRVNPTAPRPITKLARVRREKYQKLTKKIQNKTVYIIMMIIIIIPRKSKLSSRGKKSK
jgi:hypothetical protein